MTALRVGITGGIGSGKTTVTKIFATLGIPIYYSDDRAKLLMHQDEELRNQLIATFGDDTYHTGGQLNRAYLADIVFNDEGKLAQLNALVHPAVRRDGEHWQKEHQNAPYTLREAALLYESGMYRNLDKIITVTAPEALRIERVITRDHTTAEAVRARMDKQWPEAEKVERADFVIYNDSKQLLIPQVLEVHGSLMKLASNTSLV